MTTYIATFTPNELDRIAASLPDNGTPGAPLPDAEWTWYTPDSLMAQGARRHMIAYAGEPSCDVTPLNRRNICTSRSGRLLAPYPLPDWWTDAMTWLTDSLPAIPWFQRVGPVDPAWRLFPTWRAAIDAASDTGWRHIRDLYNSRLYRTIENTASRAGRFSAAATIYRSVPPAIRDAAHDAIVADATRNLIPGDERDFYDAHDRVQLLQGEIADHAIIYASLTYICRGLDIDQNIIANARATDTWDVWQRGYGTIGSVKGTIYAYEHVR